mgnify:CR=1 FL=1
MVPTLGPVLTLGQFLPGWAVGLFIAIFLVVCVVLVLTVLIQRPQGGGLSGAFGSNAGSGQTAFGAKTGDALTIATIGMFVVYILCAVLLNYAVRPTIAATPVPTVTSTDPTTGATITIPAESTTVTPAAPDDAPAATTTTEPIGITPPVSTTPPVSITPVEPAIPAVPINATARTIR